MTLKTGEALEFFPSDRRWFVHHEFLKLICKSRVSLRATVLTHELCRLLQEARS
jgi:hypothetical protein